jgi:hypothetical protein
MRPTHASLRTASLALLAVAIQSPLLAAENAGDERPYSQTPRMTIGRPSGAQNPMSGASSGRDGAGRVNAGIDLGQTAPACSIPSNWIEPVS